MYLFYYGKEGGLLSISDVGCYVTIGKLLDSIFNILPMFIYWWEAETCITIFFCKIT
jgi:hypothetical protein